MTTMLPPTRDLPPGRHQEIRARIERSVTARRRAMRFATVATAAAAAVAAVVVVMPSDADTGYFAAPPAMVPGLTQEQVKEIEDGCWKASRTPDRPVLYRYHRDSAGAFALLYVPNEALDCDLTTPGRYYSNMYIPGKKGFDTRWLAGHFSIDAWTQMSGDRVARNGHQTVAGRVDSEVRRMTWTLWGKTVDVEISNGTFVGRIVQPADWDIVKEIDRQESLKAYDADGKLIGDSHEVKDKCFVDDDGNLVSGWTEDTSTCLPAMPWR